MLTCNVELELNACHTVKVFKNGIITIFSTVLIFAPETAAALLEASLLQVLAARAEQGGAGEAG